MTTTILAVILTISCVRPFFELPEVAARVEAQRRGGYTPSASSGCFTFALLPVVLGLWWWYAVAADQLLLGVIPTASSAIAVVMSAVEISARRKSVAS